MYKLAGSTGKQGNLEPRQSLDVMWRQQFPSMMLRSMPWREEITLQRRLVTISDDAACPSLDK
jgi:hypothetical protein